VAISFLHPLFCGAIVIRVYDRTRSLPVVMIMAASLVTFWTSLTPMELIRTALAVFYSALR
jgi:hypothetical protein